MGLHRQKQTNFHLHDLPKSLFFDFRASGKQTQVHVPEPSKRDSRKTNGLRRIIDHNLFDPKAKGDGSPNIGHRRHGQFMKQRAHPFPKETFAADLFPCSLEERTSQLLRLVNGKGQHHEHGKDDG